MYTKTQLTTRIQQELKATVQSQTNQLNGWLISKVKMLEVTSGTLQSTDTKEVTVPGYKLIDNELFDLYFGSSDGKIMMDFSHQHPCGSCRYPASSIEVALPNSCDCLNTVSHLDYLFYCQSCN